MYGQIRRISLSILLVVVIGLALVWNGSGIQAHGSRVSHSSQLSSGLPYPLHPSATCMQPNRRRAISSLSLHDRLDQGYPLPVGGKTNPYVDQIVHDRGVHFCRDTDVPRHVMTHAEYDSYNWSGNFADGAKVYTCPNAMERKLYGFWHE